MQLPSPRLDGSFFVMKRFIHSRTQSDLRRRLRSTKLTQRYDPLALVARVGRIEQGQQDDAAPPPADRPMKNLSGLVIRYGF
jgi:hypothetical protein